MCHLYQLVEIFADPLRRPQPSPLTHNKSFVAKPKKKYISKLDMISTLDITNEMYTLCMSSMRICADYHLDYNLSYKDIHKNILFKIIEKFKIKTKDLNISLEYNDWFAYELLKKHVQHVHEDLERQLLNLFRKGYKKTGGTDSSKDEELERNLIREIRKKEKEVEEKEKEIEEKEKEIEEKEKEIEEKKNETATRGGRTLRKRTVTANKANKKARANKKR
ncbi:unnamed protein product [Rhizophagus irregularis]|uniref:Uncharacterized protein n=1 Tax=Rhizophagus irregularis TaxID=588596 RepID=A0A915Z065_9GLOM|nr:unnamed protein product [Rhizophagus irregularis]